MLRRPPSGERNVGGVAVKLLYSHNWYAGLISRDRANYPQNALGLAGVTPEQQQIVTGAVLIVTLIVFGASEMIVGFRSQGLRAVTSRHRCQKLSLVFQAIQAI